MKLKAKNTINHGLLVGHTFVRTATSSTSFHLFIDIPSYIYNIILNEDITRLKPSASDNHVPNGVPTSGAATQTLGITGRVMSASSNVIPCLIK